jgi:hypothetical protein
MKVFRLLIVEDNDQELATCRDTIARYKDEKHREVDLIACKNVEEAFEKLDNSFDGAIIDLKLGNQGDEGNQVVKRIAESYFRIPVAILTGTPDVADSNFAYIGVFKKGDPDAGYDNLLDRFWEIYNTGLTRIMGGRGIIEETLNNVFRKNLLPKKDKWVAYGEKEPCRTEKALLRYALNHLLQLLDDDGERCFPEEIYLIPPLTDKIRTGSIVREKSSEQRFVVMTPACDLVIRGEGKSKNGKYKTDRILIVEIEKQDEVLEQALKNITKTDKKKKKLEAVFGNSYTDYYHWLPEIDSCKGGGFLNFRKLISLPKENFDKEFDKPEIQISPFFVKDIVARFSAYYARQGQPDIDFTHLIKHQPAQSGNSQ